MVIENQVLYVVHVITIAINMLLLFAGEIGRNLAERISTGIKLFDILEKRGFLNMNNLLYLQSLLFYINRMDLFKKVATYAADKLYHSVYFQAPPDQPGMINKFLLNSSQLIMFLRQNH